MNRRAAIRATVAAAIALGCRQRGVAFKRKGNMTSLNVRFAKSEYAPLEPMALEVHISNTGPTPLELPHPGRADGLPFYRLTGPSYPEGRTFRGTPGAAVLSLGGPPPPPPTLRLEPGKEWTGMIALSSSDAPTRPGEYRLAATLDSSGEIAPAATESTMQIAPYAPVSTDLSYGVAPTQIGEGEGAILQPAGNERTLIAFEFHETAPAIREVAKPALVHRLTLPGTASDVRVPRRNTPFFDELRRYIVWRENRVVKCVSNTGVVTSFTAPFDIAELVSPALKTKDGPVEVLALSADRRKLALVQFPMSGDATLAWTLDLPTPAAAVSCALGAASGNERHIAVVSEAAGGITLAASRYSSAAPAPLATHELKGMRLVPNTLPAIFADTAGRVTVGLLVQQANGALALVESRQTGADRQDSVHEVGTQSEPATGGAILYSPTPQGDVGRRDAAILLRNGSLIRIDPEGKAGPANTRGHVFDRVQLVPGKQGPFILFINLDSGPAIEAF